MTEESNKVEYDYTEMFKSIEEFARKENISPERLWWFLKLGAELSWNLSALFFKIK